MAFDFQPITPAATESLDSYVQQTVLPNWERSLGVQPKPRVGRIARHLHATKSRLRIGPCTSAVPGDLVAGKVPVHLRARGIGNHVLVLVAVVVRYQRFPVGVEHHVPPVHQLLRLKKWGGKKKRQHATTK